MLNHSSWKIHSSYGINALGPNSASGNVSTAGWNILRVLFWSILVLSADKKRPPDPYLSKEEKFHFQKLSSWDTGCSLLHLPRSKLSSKTKLMQWRGIFRWYVGKTYIFYPMLLNKLQNFLQKYIWWLIIKIFLLEILLEVKYCHHDFMILIISTTEVPSDI